MKTIMRTLIKNPRLIPILGLLLVCSESYAQKGRIVREEIDSPSLKVNRYGDGSIRPYIVYLPPSYDHTTKLSCAPASVLLSFPWIWRVLGCEIPGALLRALVKPRDRAFFHPSRARLSTVWPTGDHRQPSADSTLRSGRANRSASSAFNEMMVLPPPRLAAL
jgi:hypothetical protein